MPSRSLDILSVTTFSTQAPEHAECCGVIRRNYLTYKVWAQSTLIESRSGQGSECMRRFSEHDGVPTRRPTSPSDKGHFHYQLMHISSFVTQIITFYYDFIVFFCNKSVDLGGQKRHYHIHLMFINP